VPATVVPSEQVNDPSVSGLEKCFDPKCNEKTDSGSCDGVVGCYWCVRDKNDAPLSNKYCADINVCYGGKEGARAPGSSDAPKDPDHDDDDDDKGGMSGGAIGGIVIGVIIPIIVVAIIVVKLRKRGRVPKNQPVQPVAAPPVVVSYNAPTPAYSPYGPEPGVPVHSTRIAMPQPSYDQTVSPAVQASAPPYNPYYKGVSAL